MNFKTSILLCSFCTTVILCYLIAISWIQYKPIPYIYYHTIVMCVRSVFRACCLPRGNIICCQKIRKRQHCSKSIIPTGWDRTARFWTTMKSPACVAKLQLSSSNYIFNTPHTMKPSIVQHWMDLQGLYRLQPWMFASWPPLLSCGCDSTAESMGQTEARASGSLLVCANVILDRSYCRCTLD